MSTRIRNIFFLLGILSVVIMVISFDMTLESITDNIMRAGRWFAFACLLWLGVKLPLSISKPTSENPAVPTYRSTAAFEPLTQLAANLF